MQATARYLVRHGLLGCYMPDSVYAVEFSTRKEFANFARQEIEQLGWPQSTIKQLRIRDTWRLIQGAKSSSSVHTGCDHEGYELAFSGLTEAEYQAYQEEDQS
jgi:hypothetical protein